jgi:hypothetical protein
MSHLAQQLDEVGNELELPGRSLARIDRINLRHDLSQFLLSEAEEIAIIVALYD